MECGVPFCHNGCPVNNLIPDWNDLVYRDRWREAIEQLHRTNNFPDFTGRLCPAPCEAACVLEIREGDAVTIKQIELAIVNRAWDEGWIVPQPPATRTGRTVAVIGAGPGRAGVRAAAQPRRAHGDGVRARRGRRRARALRRARTSRSRRPSSSAASSSSRPRASSSASASTSASTSRPTSCATSYDAIVIATGARVPRDLPVPGRELPRRALRDGLPLPAQPLRRPRARPADARRARRARSDDVITAAGKHVIVIGGGDTGADCVANAHREGAASVTQIELVGEPPPSRPGRGDAVAALAAEAAHPVRAQGGRRARLRVSTTAFPATAASSEIHWAQNTGRPPFELVAGTEETHPAGLVLLAMGFLGPEQGLLEQLGVERDERSNAKAPALRDVGRRRLRRRRRPPRPVADRVGDQRGPPVRDRGRPLARAAAAPIGTNSRPTGRFWPEKPDLTGWRQVGRLVRP